MTTTTASPQPRCDPDDRPTIFDLRDDAELERAMRCAKRLKAEREAAAAARDKKIAGRWAARR